MLQLMRRRMHSSHCTSQSVGGLIGMYDRMIIHIIVWYVVRSRGSEESRAVGEE